MMISIWTATVAFVTFGYVANTVTAEDTKTVKTTFEFVLVQQYVGKVDMIEDEADFKVSLGAHIMTTFNASIEGIEISPDRTWETVFVSYKLITNLESTYSLDVRDIMKTVIDDGQYFILYKPNDVVFQSKESSLITQESWKETWYEIGHQLLYAAIVGIVAISIFSVAVHYTCRWGKRRPTTEGRYVLNETPRTSRALPSGDNPYAEEELTSDDIVKVNIDETDVEMNGHAQANGGVPSNGEKIEMKTLKEETPQVNGKGAGADNKSFEKDENSMFAKLVYSEYSVPAKHSHEFL